jgi:hypothetical protein
MHSFIHMYVYTDRTKSDEEKAIAAREQLEELESARLRRMNMTSDVDNKDIDAALNGGEGDKKKRKRITDDEVDNTFGSGYVKDKDEEDEDEEGEDDEVYMYLCICINVYDEDQKDYVCMYTSSFYLLSILLLLQ